MLKILSTKKIDFNWSKNIHCDAIPFIRIKSIDYTVEKYNPIFLFTSINGVKSVDAKGDIAKAKKIYCVGSKTKKFIEEKSFSVAKSFEYFQEMVDFLCQSKENNFHLFAGNKRNKKLINTLKESKQVIETECYTNTALNQKTSTKYDALLFFSPSGIESYLQQNTISTEQCFCIGTTTANYLKPFSKNIHIAQKCTAESLCQKAQDYYDKK